jgi:prolipoprotein diacylglyceryltransferase
VQAAQAIDRCAAINPAWSNVKDIIVAARHSPQVREILGQILTPRHPSQLYEAGLEGLLLFILLLTIRLRFRKPDGLATGAFFLLYPIMRIIGECFREPDAPLTGPFSRGQFLSFFMFAIGFAFLYHAWRNWKTESNTKLGLEAAKQGDGELAKRPARDDAGPPKGSN